jgi:hypothetical protein
VNAPEPNGPTLAFTSNSSATIGLVRPSARPPTQWPVGPARAAVERCSSSRPSLRVNRRHRERIRNPCRNHRPANRAGITADGKTLIFAMIDGLENSNGLQNPDFANVMIGLGANAA